jgi:hypothetical protein
VTQDARTWLKQHLDIEYEDKQPFKRNRHSVKLNTMTEKELVKPLKVSRQRPMSAS